MQPMCGKAYSSQHILLHWREDLSVMNMVKAFIYNLTQHQNIHIIEIVQQMYKILYVFNARGFTLMQNFMNVATLECSLSIKSYLLSTRECMLGKDL